jgi:hypothetical protein
MTGSKLVAGLIISVLTLAGRVGHADSIIFQQGTNSYSGSQDGFVCFGGYGEDTGSIFGLNRFLLLNTEHYEDF